MTKRNFITFIIFSIGVLFFTVLALMPRVDRFDGASEDAFDDSVIEMMKGFSDEQLETLDNVSLLLGYEIQDEDFVSDADQEIDVMEELRKRLDGKSFEESIFAAEQFLKRNIEYKRSEINYEIDELIKERVARGLGDRDQRKFAYLHEQKELWLAMKDTIKGFNFDYVDDLIGANGFVRTNGNKSKVGGYLPYELEPEKYSELYRTINPDH